MWRTRPVAVLVTETLAPGSAPPDWSTTSPWMVAVALWAAAKADTTDSSAIVTSATDQTRFVNRETADMGTSGAWEDVGRTLQPTRSTAATVSVGRDDQPPVVGGRVRN